MSKIVHINAPFCPACAQRLLGCHEALVSFLQELRRLNPDAHVSCGVRGRQEQEKAFDRGSSKAHYGQSPHNFGMAIDLFRLTPQAGAAFDSPWYKGVVAPAISSRSDLVWGGTFKNLVDMPHVEVKDWHEEVKAGKGLKLAP